MTTVYHIQHVVGGSSSLHEQALVCVELPVNARVQIWLLARSEFREACIHQFGLTHGLRCSQQQYAE